MECVFLRSRAETEPKLLAVIVGKSKDFLSDVTSTFQWLNGLICFLQLTANKKLSSF